MSDAEDNDLHDSINNSIEQEISGLRRAIVFGRVMRDDARVEWLLSQHFQQIDTPLPASSETTCQALALRVATNIEADNPDYVASVQTDIRDVDISGILNTLTPDNSAEWSQYDATERAAFRRFRDDEQARDILASQQLLENESLGQQADRPPGGWLRNQIGDFIKSGKAKDLIAFSQYGLIASAMIVAPPVGLGMAASKATSKAAAWGAQKAMSTMLGDHIKATGSMLMDATERHAVRMGVIEPGKTGEMRERLNNGVRAVGDSRKTSFALALGSVVLTGVGLSLSLDGLAGDKFGTRLGNLGAEVANLVNEAMDKLPGEVNVDAAADASPVEDTPDGPGAGAGTTPLVEVTTSDSLSQTIYETYQQAGVSLDSADLYAPGSHTDHEGGLVGLVAEQNGIADPDMIQPGETIVMDGAPDATQGGAPEPAVSPPGDGPSHEENTTNAAAENSSLARAMDGALAQLAKMALVEKGLSFMSGVFAPLRSRAERETSHREEAPATGEGETPDTESTTQGERPASREEQETYGSAAISKVVELGATFTSSQPDLGSPESDVKSREPGHTRPGTEKESPKQPEQNNTDLDGAAGASPNANGSAFDDNSFFEL